MVEERDSGTPLSYVYTIAFECGALSSVQHFELIPRQTTNDSIWKHGENLFKEYTFKLAIYSSFE